MGKHQQDSVARYDRARRMVHIAMRLDIFSEEMLLEACSRELITSYIH